MCRNKCLEHSLDGMKSILIFLMTVAAFAVQAGVEWRNLDESHHLGGRKASAGYLQGKVVLVVQWNPKKSASLSGRLEEIWSSFKNKQFVLLGSPVGGEGKPLGEAGKALSFPQYADAGLTTGEPKSETLPFFYVVDETGRVVYNGYDDRHATQEFVTSLTDMESPKSLAQWRRFLDYELEHLPAHAYNRLQAFRKAYPKEAAAYREQERALTSDKSVKGVADLVAFAKRAKDAPVFTPREKAKRAKLQSLVKSVRTKCAPLKEVGDPRLVQEAKNSLADLAWMEATF